jgi:hypothetical protein
MHLLRTLVIAAALPAIVVLLSCGSDDPAGPGRIVISISPDSTAVETSSSQVFTVSSSGEIPEVEWFVGTEQGGTGATGAVNASGLYFAPAAVPDDSVVVLRAVAVDDAGISATARVVVRGGGSISKVSVVPADTTLSPGEAMTFVSLVEGCATDEVDWTVEVLSGSAGDVGSIGPDGSYTVPASIAGSVRLLVVAASRTCSDKTGISTVTVALPAEFKIELEDFTDTYDDDNGSSFISTQYCSQASSHYMVKGLDYPGEWLEVPLTVPAYGTYELVLRYATLKGDTLRATVTFDGCGASFAAPEVDFVMDQGAGLG